MKNLIDLIQQPQLEEKVKLKYELIDKREKNIKHFRIKDNEYRAVEYFKAVHYLDNNGKWEEIDNTLKKELSQNGSDYTNANPTFWQGNKFPCK